MEVDPWAVSVRHGRWYLLCWSHTKEARRVLRIDRMTKIDTLPDTFVPPAQLDPFRTIEEHLAEGWKYQVEVVVDAPLKTVAQWIPRNLGRLEEIDDDHTRLIGSTDEPGWYANRLTLVEAPFHIISPAELAEAAQALGRRLVQAGGGRRSGQAVLTFCGLRPVRRPMTIGAVGVGQGQPPHGRGMSGVLAQMTYSDRVVTRAVRDVNGLPAGWSLLQLCNAEGSDKDVASADPPGDPPYPPACRGRREAWGVARVCFGSFSACSCPEVPAGGCGGGVVGVAGDGAGGAATGGGCADRGSDASGCCCRAGNWSVVILEDGEVEGVLADGRFGTLGSSPRTGPKA
ncbi:WYL domain-containing protein [Kribbella sp. VKM Ac-2527]|uniref:WYL domain-containing protein n=2 Tax=Kribbella caucasensis TaxID=2512215 RepID=A0A4R6KII1_9ACTN|nr:WYL domain-containing protein [Kribbella sp. VKM Ac-2527]